MTGFNRLAGMAVAAGAGWLLATGADLTLDPHSTVYVMVATGLLTIGLYGSTADIDYADLRGGVRTVVLAVTVGVLGKAVLIAAVMYLVFQDPRFLVLGVAMAQIDPLAVAAMTDHGRMSPRARSLLAAWASFDDPVTVLLTVYGTAWVLGRSGITADGRSVGLGLLQNLALAAAAFAAWFLLRRLARRTGRLGPRARTAGQVVLLVAVLALAVRYSLALAVALVGLFLRPRIQRVVRGVTMLAFLAATVLVGVALAGGGVHLTAGLLLGVCAFGAQVVAGLVIPADISWSDRVHLALGQQNGITAIMLALLLEPAFPGTVGVVAPAIVVVAVLHGTTNGWLARRRRPEPAPSPVPPALDLRPASPRVASPEPSRGPAR